MAGSTSCSVLFSSRYVVADKPKWLRTPSQAAPMSPSVASANAVSPIVKMPVISAANRTSSCGAIAWEL